MKLNRKKIRDKVPKGWLITWEGIERYGSVIKHTTIRNEKTGIEFFLYDFDIIQYEKPKIKRHPICGCIIDCPVCNNSKTKYENN